MKINEENMAFAVKRLLAYSSWRNFPNQEGGIDIYVRAFLKIVHNKTVREILTENSLPGFTPTFKGLDPDQNDVDFLLDLIAEQEYFPLPVQMRELYEAYLPPASECKASRA